MTVAEALRSHVQWCSTLTHLSHSRVALKLLQLKSGCIGRFDHEWFHLVCRAACVGVAGTAAVLAAAALGVEPQGRPLDPAAVPAVGAEAVICEAQTFLSALPFVVPVRASLL